MRFRVLALAAIFPSLFGCGAYFGGKARSQASFDHHCPEERIEVVRHDAAWKNMEVNACGTLRRYQCMDEKCGTVAEEASTASKP